MSKLRRKLRLFFNFFRNQIPRKLPVGLKEHELFASKLIADNGLPDLPSYRNAIATMIMHLGPTVDRMPPQYFVKALHASMSKQVAYEVIMRIKDAEKASITDDKPVEV